MMKFNYVPGMVALLLTLGFSVFGQTVSDSSEEITPTNSEASIEAASEDASSKIMLARSSADYRVTPGDVYTLAYAAGATPISYTITVDASYRIRVSNLGIINGAGKTFMQLKNEVEATVASNYPLSGVQLVLTQPAVFRVYVNGEVNRAGEISAWGLSRLSSVAGGNLTNYASVRDITVTSSNGQTKVYDLFKARRYGDLSQDPYLRPGDVVTFNRIKRKVTVNGAVERPGTYQLLDGENLKSLIETYGNGFTPLADKTRSRLVRYIGSTEISGDIILLTEEELTGDYDLRDMDTITIPNITALRPAVPTSRLERTITITGAVRRPGTYELMPNENLQELITVYANDFTPLADKTRVTLTRYVGSSEVSGDITYLTEEELAENYPLQHLDTINIPNITELRPAVSMNRIERTITISGAVRRPGTYQLMPNENLKALIEVYADGFTAIADITRMELVRLVNSEDIAGDKLFLTENDFDYDFKLEHYDSVTIPSVVQLQPVMFVEGAINVDINTELTNTNRVVIQFAAGETYASLVRSHVGWFGAVSDIQNAYIIREEKRIPINLTPLLYDADFRDDVLVYEDDILVVPFRQYFVTVAGAVTNPGRYPYIPDRDWEYYVAMAGGFIPDRNIMDSVIIRDMNGKRLTKNSEIGPETVITARANHLMFFFNQYSPVITTILSLVTTIISLQLMTR